MGVELIRTIDKESGVLSEPTMRNIEVQSDEWVEYEYRCYESPSASVMCAFWEGEPGRIYIDPWPYDEICVLQKGRVAMIDDAGGRREFAAGESFIIPCGFTGVWETVEPSAMVFLELTPHEAGPSGSAGA